MTKDSVLLLQNGGPVGGPGMPEWGMMAIPKKLLQVTEPPPARGLGRFRLRFRLTVSKGSDNLS